MLDVGVGVVEGVEGVGVGRGIDRLQLGPSSSSCVTLAVHVTKEYSRHLILLSHSMNKAIPQQTDLCTDKACSFAACL